MNAHTPRRTIDLDALYRDLPDTRPAMRWPVGERGKWGVKVTWFDSHQTAAAYVGTHGDRFIGEPEYARVADHLGVPLSELRKRTKDQWL